MSQLYLYMNGKRVESFARCWHQIARLFHRHKWGDWVRVQEIDGRFTGEEWRLIFVVQKRACACGEVESDTVRVGSLDCNVTPPVPEFRARVL